MNTTHPIIFLDFDDVVVLNRPGQFGGYEVIAPNPQPEMWRQLFNVPSTQTLVQAIAEHDARVVITTSWLRFMLRESFEQLFSKACLKVLAQSLHAAWEAPQNRGETRAMAIDSWLAKHHCGEPYVILDDEMSGTGLRGSVHDGRRRVVLCEKDIGLHPGHLMAIRAALSEVPS